MQLAHPDTASPATPAPPISLAARLVVSLVALFTIVGPYLGDWNETHIYNPTWPPHARFHNAQTMLLGSALGACALYFLWTKARDARTRFFIAVIFAALYQVTQMASITFPGTAFVDPDRAGTGFILSIPSQLVIEVVLLTLLGVAVALVSRRVSR